MIEATTLVVDDEPMVRQLVRRILEPEVCCVVDAEDGEKALRLIQAQRETIDVVLTDLVMPGIDGFDLVEVLAHHHPDLPVVCMTGYASTVDGKRLQPTTPLLAKPFTPEEMRATIGPFIEKSRSLKRRALEQQARAAAQIASSQALFARGEANLAESVDLVAAVQRLRARRADRPSAR
jgi:two-component system, OmpR family, phosphate regulon sensor histidine kinase PhoR